MIEGILADLGFRDLQYLWFEYREVDGERVFGPANGATWWRITVRKIGSGHVLIANHAIAIYALAELRFAAPTCG